MIPETAKTYPLVAPRAPRTYVVRIRLPTLVRASCMRAWLPLDRRGSLASKDGREAAVPHPVTSVRLFICCVW